MRVGVALAQGVVGFQATEVSCDYYEEGWCPWGSKAKADQGPGEGEG